MGAHDDLAVVWFDAHPDLNTVESSPSGAFSGMVLRTLLGDGVDALVPSTPLAPDRLVLAGARSVDDGEDAYLESSGIARVGVDALDTPDGLVAAVAATGAAAGASTLPVESFFEQAASASGRTASVVRNFMGVLQWIG